MITFLLQNVDNISTTLYAHLYSDPQDAHDGHVVEGHPDVLAVIQGRHLDRPSLPG